MKFSKSGRILLALLVTLGVCLGITSCSSDYSIGFLYVTGTSTDNTTSGQVSGFKISNNTGALTPVSGSPFGTSGENPRRALVLQGGRFLYVLNGGDSTTGAGGGIALFFVGGAGTLNYQATYASQGTGPRTIVADNSNHLFEIDQYSPGADAPCVDASGVAHPVGAITAFSIDTNTGRLSLITNSQQRDANNTNLTYFPVGCFPIDGAIAGAYLYTIQQGTVATGDAESVFIYAVSASGQLTLTTNSAQATNATNLTAIISNGSNVYLLDAGPDPTSASNQSYILPYTGGGTGGALSVAPGGIVANDPNVQNPVALLVEVRTGNFVYVANAGPDTSTAGTTANSSISAFNRISNQLTLFTADEPFPTGVSPRCIVEDPSNQYIYTANHDSDTVTGHLLDTQHGTLRPLNHTTSFATGGSPSWCVTAPRVQ